MTRTCLIRVEIRSEQLGHIQYHPQKKMLSPWDGSFMPTWNVPCRVWTITGAIWLSKFQSHSWKVKAGVINFVTFPFPVRSLLGPLFLREKSMEYCLSTISRGTISYEMAMLSAFDYFPSKRKRSKHIYEFQMDPPSSYYEARDVYRISIFTSFQGRTLW